MTDTLPCCGQSKLNGSSAPVSSKKRKAVAEDSAVSAAASKPKKRSKSRTDDSSKEVPTGASSSPDATLSVATKKSRKACNGATEGVEAEDRDAAEPQAQKQRARVVHVVAAAEAPSLAQFKATPRSGWWGASRFASAGGSPSSIACKCSSVAWRPSAHLHLHCHAQPPFTCNGDVDASQHLI